MSAAVPVKHHLCIAHESSPETSSEQGDSGLGHRPSLSAMVLSAKHRQNGGIKTPKSRVMKTQGDCVVLSLGARLSSRWPK